MCLVPYGSWDHGPTPAASPERHRRPGCANGTSSLGLAVAEHQRRTVDNYLRLVDLAPEPPIVPAVQGRHLLGVPSLDH